MSDILWRIILTHPTAQSARLGRHRCRPHSYKQLLEHREDRLPFAIPILVQPPIKTAGAPGWISYIPMSRVHHSSGVLPFLRPTQLPATTIQMPLVTFSGPQPTTDKACPREVCRWRQCSARRKLPWLSISMTCMHLVCRPELISARGTRPAEEIRSFLISMAVTWFTAMDTPSGSLPKRCWRLSAPTAPAVAT